MTTNSKTEADCSSPRSQTPEWIDKAVSDTFDELLFEISPPRTQLHKSEKHNTNSPPRGLPSSTKIYEIINHYHSFCKLCEKHLYARSVATDINSFFQKHINTSYHRQMRAVGLPPNDAPMFTWEEKFVTGRCNVCNISGLNSYALDSRLSPTTLMKQHECVWDKEDRKTNEEVLRKLALLKKYCQLKVFREKFIKTMDGSTVCLLCGLKLPWSGDKASCHLASEGHYHNFSVFLQKCFNFTLKDVLNGFNLEIVTRSLISRDPPPITKFADCNDQKQCLKESNDNENPYRDFLVPETVPKDSFGFVWKQVIELLKGEQVDFIQGNECLFCNVVHKPGHVESDLDSAKLLRIANILKAKELDCWRGEPKVRTPSPRKEKEPTQNIPPEESYFNTLLKKKLELINSIFTVTSDKVIFCQVCEERVPTAYEIQHLNSPRHKQHDEKWEKLKRNFKNRKFLEPFEKIRNIIVCLLCGVTLSESSFYSHLRGEMHNREFKFYSRLDIGIPISSTFEFKSDFSCICIPCNSHLTTLCNSHLNILDNSRSNRRLLYSSLQGTLKNIKQHWPCPKLRRNDEELKKGVESELKTAEVILEADEKVIESLVEDAGEQETRSMNRVVDFLKVEKAVESIVDVFEKKIMNRVIYKSASATGQVDSLKLATSKELKKTGRAEEQPTVERTEKRTVTVQKKPSCACGQPAMCSCAAKPPTNSAVRKVEEVVPQRVVESAMRVQTNENNIPALVTDEEEKEHVKEDAKNDVKNEREEYETVEHEVLIIKGLPYRKRKHEFIYSKFKNFGKIHYIQVEGKVVILAFVNPGVAQRAFDGSAKFIENHNLVLYVTKRTRTKPVDQLPTLHKDMVRLLQDPQTLMDRVLYMIMQAVETSESPEERKREIDVCCTIIAAIHEYYPQARCYPFGSRLSGLTLDSSDLDVFVDCGGMYEGFKNTSSSVEKKLVNKVAKLLRKKQEITGMIVVDKARVPIVSFLHMPTLMNCDLSFKNGLSVQKTLLIKFLMSLDWRVKPLILFLKHWAKLNGLHGPPNFSSYAIAMLVIYYLEQLECPVLPTIESLQNTYLGRRTTIAGWNCSINMNPSDVKKSENKDSFPKLLEDLFKFYANFDYSSNVISPLTGKLLPRDSFSPSGVAKLPMSYKRHILNIPLPIENLVDKKIIICIIDPFDLSHVLTKSITSRSLNSFTHLCQASGEHLEKGLIDINSQP